MNFESQKRPEMPKNIEVTRTGDTVIVRNHSIGAALTFRDGMIVAREGNHKDLRQNTIASMEACAREAMRDKAA